MTNFKFKIEKINKINSAKVAVLDGILLNGNVLTECNAKLIHGQSETELTIKGIVIDNVANKSTNNISLVINSKTNSAALELMQEGDFLLGI